MATELTRNAKLVWRVATELENNGSLTLAAMKARTGLTETAINGALEELAEAGHITRPGE